MSMTLMKKLATPLLVGAFTLVGAGCDNDPLEPEDHPEAGGIVIVNENTGAVLATAIGRRTAFDNPITVPVGGALEVEVFFLDEDDLTERFLPDEDEGESLEVEVTNTGIATFDFHGDHGDFEGISTGSTTAIFKLMHGGHSDFDSGPLTINVVP